MKMSAYFATGRVTLIKSILIVVPSYFLEAYPIPKSILENISELARKFFLAKEGDGSGIPLIALNRTTLGKPRGLGIKTWR